MSHKRSPHVGRDTFKRIADLLELETQFYGPHSGYCVAFDRSIDALAFKALVEEAQGSARIGPGWFVFSD